MGPMAMFRGDQRNSYCLFCVCFASSSSFLVVVATWESFGVCDEKLLLVLIESQLLYLQAQVPIIRPPNQLKYHGQSNSLRNEYIYN
jgi:hypothetical protein